ncbi:MAG: mechanosensitive ion channel family protein [Aigarchaeota archaeon]|nr:mechanosensitive ion channel family protein [Aigarchaeota archaeon]
MAQAIIPVEIWPILTFAVVIVMTAVSVRAFKLFARKFLVKLNEYWAIQTQRYGSWIIWLIGATLAMDELGLDPSLLLLVIGLAGIAIIISMKEILSNLAAKSELDVYRPFKLGDWIQVGRYYGRVVDMIDTETILMTSDNEKIIVPNQVFARTVVVNRSTREGLRVTVPVTIDRSRYGLADVERLLVEVGEELRDYLVRDREPAILIAGISEKQVEMELMLYIDNPAKKQEVISEVYRRISKLPEKIEGTSKKPRNTR